MKIIVTQEHIERGHVQCGDTCPIALALKEIVGHEDLWVGNMWIRIGDKYYDPPEEADEFITRFDGEMPVEPFEFELSGAVEMYEN